MAGGLHWPAVQEARVRLLAPWLPLLPRSIFPLPHPLPSCPEPSHRGSHPCLGSSSPRPAPPHPPLQRGGGGGAAAVRGQPAQVQRVAGPAGAQGDGADHDGGCAGARGWWGLRKEAGLQGWWRATVLGGWGHRAAGQRAAGLQGRRASGLQGCCAIAGACTPGRTGLPALKLTSACRRPPWVQGHQAVFDVSEGQLDALAGSDTLRAEVITQVGGARTAGGVQPAGLARSVAQPQGQRCALGPVLAAAF